MTNIINWRRQNVQIPLRKLSKNPLTRGNENSNYEKREREEVKIKAETEPNLH